MKKFKLIGTFFLGSIVGIALFAIVSFRSDNNYAPDQDIQKPKYHLDDGSKVYQIRAHTIDANIIIVTNPNGGVAAYPESRRTP